MALNKVIPKNQATLQILQQMLKHPSLRVTLRSWIKDQWIKDHTREDDNS